MKRTTIFLDEGADRDLKALAARKGEPVASLVREAIADYIVHQAGSEVRELSFIGAGRSGRADVAERHEELLWDELGPHGPVKPASRAPRQRTSRSKR
ncbi:MAG TPA: DNA-binding protein [Thermoanaerobaculia bacterium]|jgi:predicted transcriptional regulator|nr:DNA-binding protein [Thermoanaerobaculia bacterium]